MCQLVQCGCYTVAVYIVVVIVWPFILWLCSAVVIVWLYSVCTV
jgi:hypothetical protein